ncbi:MAC/perforin domain-containing protein [Pseudomonas sp. H11T01]|uniref:MAC/perforin domain-containing protein n=1 Tax=Pseudomonas sp. H11T01 TaxID=3402749 RepID=UPI003AC40FB9
MVVQSFIAAAAKVESSCLDFLCSVFVRPYLKTGPLKTLELLQMSSNPNLIPGASALGFGVNIATSSGPSSVTTSIVSIDEANGAIVTIGANNFWLPNNVTLGTVPTPASKIKVSLYASRTDYMEQMSASADVSVSAWGFSSEFDADFSSLSEGDQISNYGTIEDCVELWGLSLKSLQGLELVPEFKQELAQLPPKFDLSTQQHFFDFFNKYGTHIVSSAEVGGNLQYAVTVLSASTFDEADAKANLSLEYDAVFADASLKAQAAWKQINTSWFSSRNAELSAIGGSPGVLSKAIPPNNPDDPVNYNDLVTSWADSLSLPENIKLTGRQLTAISNVAPVAQFHVLNQALQVYLNGSVSAHSSLTFSETIGLHGGDCTITVFNTNVQPPNVPSPGNHAIAWIVMADEQGVVKFNQNITSNNPDDFDALVDNAYNESGGNAWWTAVVYVTVPPQPMNEKGLLWLRSCGVKVPAWTGYPNWPVQLTAVGKSNDSSFAGQFEVENYPAYDNPNMEYSEWEQVVDSSFPLFISAE